MFQIGTEPDQTRLDWASLSCLDAGGNRSGVAVGPEERWEIKRRRATEQKEWLLDWSNSGPLPK